MKHNVIYCFMQNNNKPAMIRLPKELFEKIEQRQKKNRRSLNQEVIFMLYDYLDLTRNKSEAPPGEAKISRFSSAGMRPIPAALNGSTKGKPAKRLAGLPVA